MERRTQSVNVFESWEQFGAAGRCRHSQFLVLGSQFPGQAEHSEWALLQQGVPGARGGLLPVCAVSHLLTQQLLSVPAECPISRGTALPGGPPPSPGHAGDPWPAPARVGGLDWLGKACWGCCQHLTKESFTHILAWYGTFSALQQGKEKNVYV